ncbi:MAG: host attachment protein [Rickettsiales bacterium]
MKSNLSPELQRREDQALNKSNNDFQTLVLVCNSSHAKLFINRGAHDGLHMLDEEMHAIPKAGDLVSNARGRNKAGKDSQAHHAYEPPSDAREMEKANFIQRFL